MTPIRRLALLGALALPQAAPAFEGDRLSCRFDTECYDATGCVETDYRLDVAPRDGRPVLTDLSEEVPLTASEIDGSLVFTGSANGAARLLSGTEGTTARLSVHSAGGNLMLSYTGICEAME